MSYHLILSFDQLHRANLELIRPPFCIFRFDNESDTRVYWGNKVSPRDASRRPLRISFSLPSSSSAAGVPSTLYWSLFLTCPDENYTALNSDKEILHWALYAQYAPKVNVFLMRCLIYQIVLYLLSEQM